MKVQTRILLLLVALFASFAAGLAALKVAERRHFQQIARERATERNAIFDQFLAERGDALKVFVEDTSIWDDIVRAIAKEDGPWMDQHLNDETLTTWQANAVWVYRKDATLGYSRNNRFAENLHELPIPGTAMAALFGKERVCHFFCKVPQGWLEIRGGTVHPSRDRFRETRPQGYFFAGQVWMDDNIRRMALFTGYSIQIVENEKALTAGASAEEKGLITFSRALPGWDGKPVAHILVQHDSPIIRGMNRASERLYFALLIFAAGLFVVLSVSLIWWVRRPLHIISCNLEDGSPDGLKPLQREKTEFGKLAGLILASRETERALQQTEEMLRHAQKLEAVGRLAGGVAHDFNNLLTAIIGYSELLQLRLSRDPQACEQLGLIHKAGEQAASLTRQLLAFSRKQLLQPVVLDLNVLVRDMEKLLQRVIGEHIRIGINPAAPDGRVLADPTQLEQVILNLGVNARDAMPGGGALQILTKELKVETEQAGAELDLAPGDYVELCVADTGAGMDAETRARIFEPFFTTKGPGRGTGLGLATVYGIVKQSGGGIRVESEPGEGSVFRIFIPHADAPLQTLSAAPLAVERAHTGESILVLEDEEVVRDLLCAFLSDVGYDVLCAGTPSEALAKVQAREEKIDLLISDVILPEMHGPVIARTLLTLQPAMKVLFVSGYSENDISDQGVVEPGVEILSKPFSQQGLLRKVRAILDGAGAPQSGPLPG